MLEFMDFLDLFYVRYICAKFHNFIIVGYVWQILGRGTFLYPASHHIIREQPSKPILNKVKEDKLLV